jgi:tRNA-dihydrouridine synthase A
MADPAGSREQVEDGWLAYLDRLHAAGTPWSYAMRHALGLWNGTPGARRWRQVWSDHRLKALPPRDVAARATAARLLGQLAQAA